MNIAVYASDHGYGHLTRQLGWIEKIDWSGKDKIFLINSNGVRLINNKKNFNIVCVSRPSDTGPAISDSSMDVDVIKTKQVLDKWNGKFDWLVKRECEWLQQYSIDKIISDISPIPFVAADKIGIPSLAVSSFTWYWIFSSILPDHPICQKLKNAYELATDAYRLPLSEDMSIFRNLKNISLIVRTKLNEPEFEFIKTKPTIFISMGYSVNPEINKIRINSKFDFILSSNLKKFSNNHLIIPSETTVVSSYIKKADFALIKTGYSLVAECINLKIPIIGVKRNLIEDEMVGKYISHLNIGEIINFCDLGNYDLGSFDYAKYRSNLMELGPMYDNSGWIEVEKWVKN